VVRPGDPALARAHRLLRREFHASELLSRKDWEHVLHERAHGLWTDTAWHLVVAESGGRVVGLASGNYVGSLNVGLVGYVAVAPVARARGLGVRLRRALRVRFERDARRIRGRPLEAIMGEVRADNPWLRHLVARDEAIALDFPYRQPSLGRSGRPVPLVLYYQPRRRRRRSLSAAELRRLLYGLWRRPYRVPQPLSRPAFRRMLASLEGRRRIGALELSELDADRAAAGRKSRTRARATWRRFRARLRKTAAARRGPTGESRDGCARPRCPAAARRAGGTRRSSRCPTPRRRRR
jgi:hypothetical protein